MCVSKRGDEKLKVKISGAFVMTFGNTNERGDEDWNKAETN